MVAKPSFPIPFTLLDLESQDAFTSYLHRLQEERELLVEREQEMQELTEQKAGMQSVMIELKEQRTALVDRFISLRNSLSAIVREQKERIANESPNSNDRSILDLEITVRTNAKKLKALEAHLAIVNEKVQQATNLHKELLYRNSELRMHREYPEVKELEQERQFLKLESERLRVDADRAEMSGIEGSIEKERTELDPRLAKRLREWNIVTRDAMDAIRGAHATVENGGRERDEEEPEAKPEEEVADALRARIRKIDAVLVNVKL
jgi:hypothetical protein